jgi:hypothetical protein
VAQQNLGATEPIRAAVGPVIQPQLTNAMELAEVDLPPLVCTARGIVGAASQVVVGRAK